MLARGEPGDAMRVPHAPDHARAPDQFQDPCRVCTRSRKPPLLAIATPHRAVFNRGPRCRPGTR
jgi:hypothetical protein